MTRSHDSDPEVGLLRMLRVALESGLAPGADDEAFAGARSAVQLIGLPGLEAGLDALEPHRGAPRTGAALELVAFIERLVAGNDLRGVRAGDREIESRAAGLRATPHAGDAAGADDPGLGGAIAGGAGEDGEAAEVPLPPPGALFVAEVLGELPLSGDRGTERAGRTWLMPQVAAALRAALDWLSGDLERPRPFRLRAEDSVLEVVCEHVNPEGLMAAHEVLAAAGGNLAPYAEVGPRAIAGAWLVRVPAWSPRPVHLMFEQGDLRLALPWHAVLRLSMVPSIEIEMRGGSLATPVLEPLVPLDSGLGERPVVAIAHGLKRALLVADRLVWRLGAEACDPPGAPPVPGLHAAVRSDESEVFWVADPGMLLSEVAIPPVQGPGPAPARPQPPAASPRVSTPAPVAPAPTAIEPTPPVRAAKAPEELLTLTAADVEPLVLSATDVEPLESAAALPAPAEAAPPAVAAAIATLAPPAVAAPAEAEPRVLPAWLERFGATGGPGRSAPATDPPSIPRPAAPGVLIAEDSLAARHFLTRLFERRGLAVLPVENAAALRAAIPQRAWSLVCVDVELPDAVGRRFFDELRAVGALADVPLVALVRDDDDAERAAEAGVVRWLRKPFDGDEVDHLLARLGLAPEVGS